MALSTAAGAGLDPDVAGLDQEANLSQGDSPASVLEGHKDRCTSLAHF